MNPTEYVKNAIKTESNDFPLIASRLSNPTNIRLLHAFMGIGTEAGEINDALKKAILYGKTFDRANAVEELGDLMWYIALACDAIEVSLEEVMEKNIAKLKARYGDKFTAEAALNRDLKTERQILES